MGKRGFAEETKANVASDDRCQEEGDNETLICRLVWEIER